MKHFLIILLSIVIFSSLSFGGTTMETFILPNGIKVIFKQTKSVEILSLKFHSPISVLQEDISRSGETALLYAVMSKSTNKRNSETLATDIENLGASISSIQSIKARKDSIKSVANDRFISDFYDKSHPYSKIKSGNEETLKILTQQDLKDIYNKIYSTKGIVITVVGNIKKSVLKETLNKYFGQMSFTLENKKNNLKNNPLRIKEDVVVKSKFNQAFIIYAYDCPDVSSKDFTTLKLINVVLGGRMTGRLFIELREKLGLAYEVNCDYPTRIDSSYFKVYIGLDKKNIDITKKGIEKIMNDLCTIKISEKELLDTKNFIKGIYLLAHQSVERQAYYLAVREMVGLGYEYDDKYIEELFKVTSDDIIKVANKYFKHKPYKLILMPN